LEALRSSFPRRRESSGFIRDFPLGAETSLRGAKRRGNPEVLRTTSCALDCFGKPRNDRLDFIDLTV
jgi:hypothetical protein